ncbi:MAG TPA: type II toxin-antitoxin system VapC family toxin [Rhizobiaceae bacterium]|nr:type II toxin-antitoxin system VapC family toxin [Rhizobiaceae bacterium]
MLIDASALTAILAGEPDGPAFAARIEAATKRLTIPMAMWETALAVSRIVSASISDVEAKMTELIEFLEVEVVTVDAETARLAIDAHARYGKGRHPAKLNFGDCFAYAAARQHGMPLLFKGEDFALTDIRAA